MKASGWYICFVALISAPLTMAAHVHFTVRASHYSVYAGEPVDLIIIAEWPQTDGSYIVYPPQFPRLCGARITDHIAFGEAFSTPSNTFQRVIHHVTLIVTNASRSHVSTGDILLRYRHSDDDTPRQESLAGLSLAVVTSNPLIPYLYIGGISIACVTLFRLFVRRRERTHKNANFAPTPTREDLYLAALADTHKLRVEGDLCTYFTRVEDLIRTYIREKYCIGNIETWEAHRHGPAGPDEHIVNTARDICELSHRVRYAHHTPTPQEIERAYSFLKNICKHHKPTMYTQNNDVYLT